MSLSEIFKSKRTVMSFEVFPPKKQMPLESIYDTLDELKSLKPDFISVTYGAGGTGNVDTTKIAELIYKQYNIKALAHLTCINSSKGSILKTLGELKGTGVGSVLALRGDMVPGMPLSGDFTHASDLVKVVKEIGGFYIAAACYPEGHPESRSLEADIENLKLKVDAGADHLISQLFFNNDDFFRFLDKIRNRGINLPVEAGIMPVINAKQISRMVSLCGASIPKKLSNLINRYGSNNEAMRAAGIAYAVEQISELSAGGVDGIHLYTMNNPEVARSIVGSVKTLVDCVNE